MNQNIVLHKPFGNVLCVGNMSKKWELCNAEILFSCSLVKQILVCCVRIITILIVFCFVFFFFTLFSFLVLALLITRNDFMCSHVDYSVFTWLVSIH